MDREYVDRSSDIRDILQEELSDNDSVDDRVNNSENNSVNNSVNSDESDIEADDVPSEFSLEDFSSGSAEEYEPNFDDIDSSEVDEPDLGLAQGRGTISDSNDTSDPIANRPRPIPLMPPSPTPEWIRVYPPEIENDATFSGGVTGPRNMLLRKAHNIFSIVFYHCCAKSYCKAYQLLC